MEDRMIPNILIPLLITDNFWLTHLVSLCKLQQQKDKVNFYLASGKKNDKVYTRFIRQAGIRSEIERALKLTAGCSDFREMRLKFDEIYSGTGVPYAQSYANEIVTKAAAQKYPLPGKIASGEGWFTEEQMAEISGRYTPEIVRHIGVHCLSLTDHNLYQYLI